MSEPGQTESPEPSDERVKSIIEAAERAASEILADATQEAQRRVAEARERAEAVGRERVEMMSALSDSLLEQATTVKRQADVLIEALDRVIATLENELAKGSRRQSAPPAAQSRPAPPRPATPPVAPQQPTRDSATRQRALEAIRERIARSAEEARRAAPSAPQSGSVPAQEPQAPPKPAARKPVSEGAAEGARILATQMAVAGSTQAEILVRLRKEFGIEDPEPIVEAVVGDSGEPR